MKQYFSFGKLARIDGAGAIAEKMFMSCFQKNLVATPACYLVATRSQIVAAQARMLRSRGLVATSDEVLCPEEVLPATMLMRLEEYKKKKADMVANGIISDTDYRVLNLTQNASFSGPGAAKNTVGCLLTRSLLLDSVADRAYVVYPEYFAVQGWPVPCGKETEVAPWAPWGADYERLLASCDFDELHLKKFLGNSTHLGAVGAFTMFGLAMVSFKDQTLEFGAMDEEDEFD